MPHLHRLVSTQGVLFGSDLAPMKVSNSSTVSLPGYAEIFSGRRSSCSNNDCPTTSEPTLLDAWLQRDPSAELTIIASWSRIARAAAMDASGMAVSAGQTVRVHEERFCANDELCREYRAGLHTSPWPGAEDYRPDRATSALVATYLRVHQPRFLFVGLGDTDEHAHRGDYRNYLRALHAADSTLGLVSHWLEQKRREGHPTLLICTADHGRARNFNHHGGAPEAARVWALFAGSVVTSRNQLVAPTAHLIDIAPTIASLLGLPGDLGTTGRSLLTTLTAQNEIGRVAVHFPAYGSK
jgi:arylsulfatase A-like enzyme